MVRLLSAFGLILDFLISFDFTYLWSLVLELEVLQMSCVYVLGHGFGFVGLLVWCVRLVMSHTFGLGLFYLICSILVASSLGSVNVVGMRGKRSSGRTFECRHN